jgi:hypothetical protein
LRRHLVKEFFVEVKACCGFVWHGRVG